MAEINDSLKQTNDELKKVLASLGAINKESGKTPGLVSKALSGIKKFMGGGGDRQLGAGQSGSMMSHMEGKFSGDSSYRDYQTEANAVIARFSGANKTLGVAQGVAQATFGVVAGVAAAVPGVSEVLSQSANYYGASLASGGMNRNAINRATFSGLNGGVTSTLSPSTTAAILAARGVTPGSAQYNQMIGQIGGAARYMNMANENAAVAMSGMNQGSMSSNLYAAGISTFNSATGQQRSSSEIFGQLYDRMTAGQGKMSVQDINNSIQSGMLGAQASALGMSEDQKQLFYQYFRDRSQGKQTDLSKLGYGNNPLGDKMRLTTSDTSVLNKYEQPMLDGFKTATDLIVNKVNPALESVAKTAGTAAGFLGGLSESRAGAGLGVALGGIMKGIETVLFALAAGGMAKSALGIGARGAVAAEGAVAGVSGGAVAAATVVPALGGYVAGKGGKALGAKLGTSKTVTRAGSAAAGAGTGALIGTAILPGVGTIIGSIVGGVGGYLGSGGPSSTGFGASFNSSGGTINPATPINGGTVGAGYGEKGPLWGAQGHSGQDYPCPIGTPVVAALDGVVYDDGLGAAYGTYIQIDHGNGYQTIYGHLSEKLVTVGSTVTKGQVIGKSGDTGHVTGPHLHFEVRKGKNNVVDPKELKGADNGGIASSLSGLLSATNPTMLQNDVSGVKVSNASLSQLFGSKSSLELANSTAASAMPMGQNNNSTAASTSGNQLPANADSSLLSTLQAAGFSGSSLATAYAIVKAESGGRPDAYNGNAKTGDNSYGLFQINMLGSMGDARRQKFGLNDNSQLFDPTTNAKIAYAISNGGTNFNAWSTYKSGAYQKYLGPQGGPVSTGVATPSMSSDAQVISPQITINASFTGTGEAEAIRLVNIVKTELEKTTSYSALGKA